MAAGYPVPVTPRFRWTLAAIVVAGFALTLVRLDHFSFWLDEVLQSYWISGDWAFLWKSLRFDAVHPPLDYVADKLFGAFHPGDAARKLLPALWGAGGTAAFGVLLARRGGPLLGLAAAALLAFTPYHVRFSQELRPYSLALFLLCLALCALDGFLERPGTWRLAALYLACLATAYTLYTAGLVLAIAAAALLVEDAFSEALPRRRSARRSLAWSPVFVLALAAGYLPWAPVVLAALRRPPMAPLAPLTLERAGRVAAFFAFAPGDGAALSAWGVLFFVLVACGAWIVLFRRGLRFLAAWGIGGAAAIETLFRLHPHFDASRRFLPAGLAVTALAAAALAAMLARPVTRLPAVALLAAILVLDVRALRVYFREGRIDWRPVAEYLRREASPAERIFAENQHTQLCVAYYLVGPRWLFDASAGRDPGRSIVDVGPGTGTLSRAWLPGTRGWLVLAAGPENRWLRRWAATFPSRTFPTAAGAIVRRLDPAGDPGR